MPRLSVIICTHSHEDRLSGLRKTVNSLSENENYNKIFEVIIVDNGCSIKENEKKELQKVNPKVIFVNEKKIGLSIARNTGVKKSKGSILAFTDDDVWVSNTWAKSIIEIFKDKIVLCAGGELKMTNTKILQNKKWVSNYFLRFLYPTTFPSKTGRINSPYFLVGANMSFRKEVFDKFGMFDTNLGRISKKLLSCEDTEFIGRIPKENIFFVENATVLGEIDEKRLTKRYMLRRLFWQGYSDYIFIQKVGVDRFFDKKEVILSLDFIKFTFSKLIQLKFFEFICIFSRLFGFYSSKEKESRPKPTLF